MLVSLLMLSPFRRGYVLEPLRICLLARDRPSAAPDEEPGIGCSACGVEEAPGDRRGIRVMSLDRVKSLLLETRSAGERALLGPAAGASEARLPSDEPGDASLSDSSLETRCR